MYPVELRGARVLARELAPGDVTGIRPYAEDPEVHRYTIWQPDREEDTVAFLRQVAEDGRAMPRTKYDLAICLDGTLAGGVGLHLGGPGDLRGSLGYVLRRDLWSRGIATEAARLMTAFGFETLGLRRIEAECAPENRASARVMEKLGMRLEGRLSAHHVLGGVWRDCLVHAILAEEWLVLRGFGEHARETCGLPLDLERVSPERIEEIHELMRVVGRDMLERFAMDHWSEPWPVEEMRADARRRETYAARAPDGGLVASFTIGLESLWLSEEGLPWAPAAKPLWFNRLMVDPAYQNRGLGALLMRAAEALARARGCDAVRLETRTDFDAVQRFYKRLGYVERHAQPASDRWSAWSALDKRLEP